MKKLISSMLFAAVVAMIAASLPAYAVAPLETERIEYKASHYVPFLIMTSNFESPFFLAESARINRNVAYLLFPPDDSGSVLFVPPLKGNTIVIERAKLAKFIAFLRPRNVIVLGDKTILPEAYRKAVPVRIQTTLITDTNWKHNALVLSNLINYPAMQREYQEFLNRKAAQAVLNAKIRAELSAGEKTSSQQ